MRGTRSLLPVLLVLTLAGCALDTPRQARIKEQNMDRRLLLGPRGALVHGDQIFYQDGKSGMIIGDQVFGARPGMIIGDQIFYFNGETGLVR